MSIARYYDETKNLEGAVLDGVPLRDLTEDEFSELPPWLQASVDASPLYRKTKPRPAPSGDVATLKEDPGGGVETTAIEAPADGSEAELVAEPDRKRR